MIRFYRFYGDEQLNDYDGLGHSLRLVTDNEIIYYILM